MRTQRRMGASFTWLAIITAILAISTVDGTTLRRMDMPELVDTAERVVHARVVSQRVYWDAGRTRIFTETDFEVLEEAKGQGPETVTIKLMGGQIDGIDLVVPGTPVFYPGEETLLFTYPRPDGKKHLVGLSQGVMRVRVNPETGEKTAVGEVHSNVLYLESVEGELKPTRPRSNRVPLSQVLNNVRQIDRGRINRDPEPVKRSDRPQLEQVGGGK